MSKPHVIRTEPFPVRVLARISERKERATVSRLKINCSNMGWFVRNERRYRTVSLALTRRGWMLCYEGKPNTGPFKTKAKCIAWLTRGGR